MFIIFRDRMKLRNHIVEEIQTNHTPLYLKELIQTKNTHSIYRQLSMEKLFQKSSKHQNQTLKFWSSNFMSTIKIRFEKVVTVYTSSDPRDDILKSVNLIYYWVFFPYRISTSTFWKCKAKHKVEKVNIKNMIVIWITSCENKSWISIFLTCIRKMINEIDDVKISNKNSVSLTVSRNDSVVIIIAT